MSRLSPIFTPFSAGVAGSVCRATVERRRAMLAATAFAFVTSTAAPAFCAPPQETTIRAGVDVGAHTARDDLIVPRASSGPSIGVSGGFLGVVGPSLVETGMRFQVAALFDRDGHPAASIFYALRIAYLPVVRTRPREWSLAVGPLLAWDTDILWLAKWDDAHAYWMGRRYLGVEARAWRPLTAKMRLDLVGELGILGFESRPPAYRFEDEDALTHVGFYFAGVQRDARFGTLLDWQAMRLEADLSRTSADGRPRGGAVGLEARVAHTDAPAQAIAVELDLRLSYDWALR